VWWDMMIKNLVKRYEVEIRSKKDMAQVQKIANTSLFRPIEKFSDQERYIDKAKLQKEVIEMIHTRTRQINEIHHELALLQKILRQELLEKRKRWMWIHYTVKKWLMYPLLKFIKKRIGKYLVKSINDIPDEWNNNWLRMFYHSFDKGLDDMWIYMHYDMNPKHGAKYPKFKEYLTFCRRKDNQGDWGRRLLINIWMTEVLEDSIDREWFNMSIMNLVHSAMSFYGIADTEMKKVPKPGEFPVYKTANEFNPIYFVTNMDYPVWNLPPKFDYDKHKEEVDKLAKEKEQAAKQSKGDDTEQSDRELQRGKGKGRGGQGEKVKTGR
jgi:hypothetical protein